MTTPEKVIRDDVRAMSAYPVLPAAGMVKLDAMENPYSLPAPLREKIAALIASAPLNRYPDPLAPALKARLRQVMGIPEGLDILLGNGSDEIIQMIIQACARPGASIMAPGPTFAMYRQYSLIARLNYQGVPLRPDFSLDLAPFLAAMSAHQPAVVFLAYPNNPTGNLFAEEDLLRLIREAPGLVVIDEAYQPFAERSFMQRLKEIPNLLLLRTVSKLGLAGIRLGYAVGRPEWIAEVDKVRSPYNVNMLTQLIAETLLGYPEVFAQQASAIREQRAMLTAALAKLPGVRPFPSQANFVLARVPDARRTFEELRQRGILVKSLHGLDALLDQCVRFTIGTPEENALLMDALQSILGAPQNGALTADRVG